jgi:aminopeptidase N
MKNILTFLVILCAFNAFAQPNFFANNKFTEADTLRGMLRPERTCFDVTFYDINLNVDIEKQFIGGFVDVEYTILNDFRTLQLDLFENMRILSITSNNQSLLFRRQYNAVFVEFPVLQKQGAAGKLRVQYEGKPQVAENAPWDGGFVWSKDKNDKPWVGVACEGTGASLWWPCKDHLSDEPDSVMIRLTIPSNLTAVANGNLKAKTNNNNGTTRFDWLISYPINTYNVTVNIADYANFKETYTALDGEKLELDYHVLAYNLERAKKHFQQVPKVLACYERFFGKYPFWRDGFGMVETPYLGMEHQGAIAYGNYYMRGYLGGMIPKNMNWDYIIVHETGHEYFGNSVSCKDIAEYWIHESFTTYMEALYVECAYNYEEAVAYLMTQRPFINNSQPIVGPLNVNFEGWTSSDQYYKGAWMLHTLRHAINDDEMWFDLLRSFYNRFALSNITTQDFIGFVNQCLKKDFTPILEQYLYYPNIPTLEFRVKAQGKQKVKLEYRWLSDVADFNMPILVGKKGAYQMIYPTKDWKQIVLTNVKIADFKIATELFYVNTSQVQAEK